MWFAPDVRRDGQVGDVWVDDDGEEHFVPIADAEEVSS